MSLIIKNKIGNVLVGTPTVSDKYDVITATVGNTVVKSGQIVAFDNIFKEGEKPVVIEPTETSKYIGVVMHQNIHLEEKSKEPQEFQPGEVVGICIKGFVTALGKKGVVIDGDLKIKNGQLDETGTVTLKNIKATGYKQELKNYSIVEVEIK